MYFRFSYNDTGAGFCWFGASEDSSWIKISQANLSNQITATKLKTSMKMPKAKYPRSRMGSAFKNIRDVGSCQEDSDHAAYVPLWKS